MNNYNKLSKSELLAYIKTLEEKIQRDDNV